MNILLIASHAGGGVGSVLMDWVDRDVENHYTIALLDYANDKIEKWGISHPLTVYSKMEDQHDILGNLISFSDVVVINYWDHPMLHSLLSFPLPACRLVSWCHKNTKYSAEEINYSDIWVDTSPIQNNGRYIWSSINIQRFLSLIPIQHKGFVVGTVLSPKLHPQWFDMCDEIKRLIPDAKFISLGDHNVNRFYPDYYEFTGKVDDVAPYLAEFDVFGYPLRPDHYGTGEQVLGEAMAAGVVPVVMDNPCERLIWTGGCRSTEEYVKEVCLLGRGPGERYLLSSVARERAKKIYSIDNMISQWNAVFEEMMSKPKRERTPL